MPVKSLWACIKNLKRPFFTTTELAAISRKSVSSVSQSLRRLEKQDLIENIHRGIWIEKGHEQINPYRIIPFLFAKNRVYVSFLSALRLNGLIEQIPQNISLASMTHSKRIHTKYWTYQVHRIDPRFFTGFGWYKESDSFLVATPEKALADCLYLSTRKNKSYAHFPELTFPKSFKWRKVNDWIGEIADKRIKSAMARKLQQIRGDFFS